MKRKKIMEEKLTMEKLMNKLEMLLSIIAVIAVVIAEMIIAHNTNIIVSQAFISVIVIITSVITKKITINNSPTDEFSNKKLFNLEISSKDGTMVLHELVTNHIIKENDLKEIYIKQMMRTADYNSAIIKGVLGYDFKKSFETKETRRFTV